MDASMFTGWRKSTRSTGNPNNCVEVATAHRLRAVRDSKNPTGPLLVLTSDAFGVFLNDVTHDAAD